MNDKDRKIIELQKKIEKLEEVREILGSPVVDEKVAEIQKEINKINTDGGAYIEGDVKPKHDFVNRDKIINFYLTEKFWEEIDYPPTHDEEEASRQYLQNLYNRHRYLNFRGMGVVDRIPLKFSLLDIYVPLLACQELPKGDTWERAQIGGRDLQDEEGQALHMSEPREVIGILRKNKGLIILGDPGSGKTTFLKYLALMTSCGKGEELGLGERFPLLVPLSAYANALSNGDRVSLDDFIAEHFYETSNNKTVDALMKKALKAGSGLVLFDGLDEVKEPALRQTVIDRVINFYHQYYALGNKFVITSRIVGYREVRLVADGLVECTLVDFSKKEIQSFVENWTLALENQAQGEGESARLDAEKEKQELLQAVEENPGVRRLAANPLILTILALMKRQGVTLPERRV